ncbi:MULTISPECIES: autotransporter domain-containing protein [unclassified Iodidimonas]|jgi:uncharacterized protein YhjY with autotransporter beta-barrel domain|uniref:autotransporter domain-containing protein n=1 Tax=unclassified Iodidimonas TaxID=2626145 RepID=UPI0024821F28|nr:MULTISPECIES: autotransporter domain-containing protein [unclassified Iodidimonas]
MTFSFHKTLASTITGAALFGAASLLGVPHPLAASPVEAQTKDQSGLDGLFAAKTAQAQKLLLDLGGMSSPIRKEGVSTSFLGHDVRLRPNILIAESLGTTDDILDLDGSFDNVLGLAFFDLRTGQITGFCSGTLVNARTVISAAHCNRPDGSTEADDRNLGVAVTLGANGIDDINNGNFVFASSHVTPVEFLRDNFSAGYDITTIALQERITGITPAGIVTSAPELGTEVTFVGFGTTGTGSVESSFFDFRRRAATNTLDFIGGFNGAILPDSLLFTDFDDPANPGLFDFFATPDTTSLEGTTGSGDSGGALFVRGENGELLLAGITSGGFNIFSNDINQFGDVAFFTNIAEMQDFIAATNPLIETRAAAGDGDWLDPTRWTNGFVPANFDPLRDAGDPTLIASFFEVTLDAPGTTSLSNAAIEIDTLSLSGEAALSVEAAQLDVVDFISVAGGRLDVTGANLLSGSLFISGGAVSIDADSVYSDASRFIDAGLVMSGGTLDIAGQFSTDFLDLRGGSLRIAEGGLVTDFVGSLLSGGTMAVDGTFDSQNFFLDGAALTIGATGIIADQGTVSTMGSGSLLVNGQFQTGALGLMGGTLGGNGTIIAPLGVAQSGGVLSPGTSVGTLTIIGDLFQDSGATTRIEIDQTGAIDLIAVREFAPGQGGNVVLDGTILVETAAGVNLGRGDRFNFVEADGSIENRANVVGQVTALNGSSSVLRFRNSLDANGNAAGVTVFALPFAPQATSVQQRDVARALDGISSGTSIESEGLRDVVQRLDRLGTNGQLQASLQSLNPTQTFLFDRYGFQLSRILANTLSQRAGTIRSGRHGGIDGTMGNAASSLRLAANDEAGAMIAAAAQNAESTSANASANQAANGGSARSSARSSALGVPDDIGLFFSADFLNSESQMVEGEFDSTTFSMTMGIDKRIGRNALIGVAGTFANFSTDELNGHDSSATAGGISTYGSIFHGPYYASGYTGVQFYDLESTRPVITDVTSFARGDGSARQFMGGFDLGASYGDGPVRLGPLVRLRHSSLDINAFEEMGSGATDTIIDDRKARETVLGIGGELSIDVAGKNHSTSAFSRITWQRRIGGKGQFLTDAAFVGDRTVDFTVTGTEIDSKYATYALGINSMIGVNTSIQLAFESDIDRDDVDEYQLSFGIKIGF